ncbi:MAG TPA: ribose-phosphate pyrophosphokinase-like domain-containing protein, partial [Nocardioides sp.]|nr:ribose-phosphate pyrophosphokinase-like domain-containing protein [Nocardioides sp.]
MSGIQRTTQKNLMVFSGRAHPELAEEVAEILGTPIVPTQAYEFANSEIYVRYEESVRGCDAFVIQSHTAPINEWIMEHQPAAGGHRGDHDQRDHRGQRPGQAGLLHRDLLSAATGVTDRRRVARAPLTAPRRAANGGLSHQDRYFSSARSSRQMPSTSGSSTHS